jgi:hypothetical protein
MLPPALREPCGKSFPWQTFELSKYSIPSTRTCIRQVAVAMIAFRFEEGLFMTTNIWSLFASAGGKAGTGKAKKRSKAHYRRISALAATARAAKARARQLAVKPT